MRVVVASDALAGLSPAGASEAIAAAFAGQGAEVAVVQLGVIGRPLREGLAASAPEFHVASPRTPGELVEALAVDAPSIVLDLTTIECDDLGRGALGPDPRGALEALRRACAGRRVVALVQESQVDRELTGLAGHASIELRAKGADLAQVLAADLEAERWAAELGLAPAPGSGAAGGLGLLIQGIGGVVADPLGFLADRFGLASTIARADLVVTGAESLDFHALGGPVVKRVAALATEALRPVIGIVGRNFVSSRELRLAGFEAAYPLLRGAGDGNAEPRRLGEVAAHVARTWIW
ncbi:glycerate kinase [Tessaracoccus bendigoensis DSM 12906]|uniref:Glycerate kinase n=1 Tax=Tessaracoccus bendigoensis DSM 12906 TaxID=1123357 RepID=A0A1M6AVE9_9ACTN|nr:glycerate kinase [Tessaracoccus bendigoensis]SHI40417.1 glycerate kinase [Tessaracoccus bendigoensis DSM 12906]